MMELVGRSYSPEIRHIGNGTHRKSFVNKTIVHKHVGHAINCNSKTSTKTEAGKKALIEESIGKKGNCWDCIYYCKHIV
uniref:Beta-carotene hydroxylase 5 n=1 Tax=Rhizophora mucronata TaxID=61149 RepID=A0A2P2K3T4_RHIMU